MSRYEEAYHGLLSHASDESNGAVSIHEAVRSKEKNLARLARPDARPRRSAVDRIVAASACGTAAWEAEGPARRGAMPSRVRAIAVAIGRENGAVGALMAADGLVPGAGRAVSRCSIEKTVWLVPDEAVRVEHTISAGAPADLVFASEWNLAFLTGHIRLRLSRGRRGAGCAASRSRSCSRSAARCASSTG